MSRTRYRMDRRTYRQTFGPGFFCTAYGINFLDTSHNGRGSSRRFRRLLMGVLMMGTMAGLGWVAVESIAFFSMF
ncbi:MAG: hypothetical protein JJU20_13835 [Opitutales bacterium]|nr:hypothetical protein [Opitutales bacterium]